MRVKAYLTQLIKSEKISIFELDERLEDMIGLNAIKPKRKNMHIILAIIGLVMIIPYILKSPIGT